MKSLSGAVIRKRKREIEVWGGGGVELESQKANYYGHNSKGVLSGKRVQYMKVLQYHLPGYNRRKFRPVSSLALVLPCTASKIKHC